MLMHTHYLLRVFLALATTFSFISCEAGTKGFNAVMINIGDESFRTSPIYREFSSKTENNPCWNKMNLADGVSGLNLLIFKKPPPEMTRELGQAIWNGDRTAVQIARTSLKKHHIEYEVSELHGLYIIKPIGKNISVMSIGINSGRGKNTGISKKIENIPLDSQNPTKAAITFEQSLCRVSKPFNIGFSI